MKEGLKFSSAESQEFMGMPNTTIDIGGRSFVISGKNGVGKSRLINLLLSGIDSKNMPSEVITTGETKGYSKVLISGILNGKPEEYIIEMFYTPKNKSGRIVLTDKEGNKVNSPKEILKGIIGNISFDIMRFLDDTKANKIKILKELSGVRVEFDKLEMTRKEIFDKRTLLNAVIDRDETLMNNHGLKADEIDLYAEPQDIAPIQKELDDISPKITNWNRIKNGTADFKKEFEITIPALAQKELDAVTEKEAMIEKLKLEVEAHHNTVVIHTQLRDEAKVNYDKGVKWLENNPEPNAQEISTRLSNTNLHNKNHEKVKQLIEKQKSLHTDKHQAMKYTAEIDKIILDKEKLISKSKLPIKGLTFTDEDIFYNGLPLEDRQINSATLLKIGTEISMALNPKLKTIFVHEGSLFDKGSLKTLIKDVEAKGYQVICECVSESDELDIKFLETESEA